MNQTNGTSATAPPGAEGPAAEAERCLMGSLLLAPEGRPDLSMISADDLYFERHKQVFSVLVDLDREGVPVDGVSVRERLARAGLLEEIGGSNLLVDLVNEVPSPANVQFYASIVRDAAFRRRMRTGALELARLAAEPSVDASRLEEIASGLVSLKGSAHRALSCVTLEDLLARTLPPREVLLAPILRRKDLAMIHAWRGAGKTWTVHGIAAAVASGGSFLRWTAPQRRKVLLVDGEMAAEDLQGRLASVIASMPSAPEPEYLHIVAADMQDQGIPSLATPAGQALLAPHVEDRDLIILDNLSTLASAGPENDAESADALQEYILRLRRMGKTVVLVHHDGKGREQRGTSKKEDVLNLVLHLRHPRDYKPSDGARFEVHFGKARGLHGDAVVPFEAWAQSAADGHLSWKIADCEAAWLEEAKTLKAEGLSLRDIGEIVGRDKGTVSRALRGVR